MTEVRSLTSRSYCQNAEVNQRANNTVDDPARRKRDMENAGGHGSGGDRDGNRDGREADTSAERAGPPRGNQSACGWRPDRKGLVHNPYLPNKGQMPSSCHEWQRHPFAAVVRFE
jgi:hypothetical protein